MRHKATPSVFQAVAVLSFFGFCLSVIDEVNAQIVPDATLGNERSRVHSDAVVRGRKAARIEGGAIRGGNLFHSFEAFNVREGQRVYFSDPIGIENVFSRVTGSQISEILGTLGVEGQANLFLLNPNGILFGPNARLDVNGSFVASTARQFLFADGSEFSAVSPQMPPLLALSVPIGIQGVNLAGDITNRANLTAGQDLTLTAANLDLQGQLNAGRNLNLQAQNTLRIRDSNTHPFIAASGRQMTVQGNQAIDVFALNHPNSSFFAGGNILLRSLNSVSGDAHYWSGGDFRIERLNGNLGNFVSLYDPVIRSFGDVSFRNYRGASLHIIAGGQVNISSNVIITSPDTVEGISETITLSDGTRVQVDGKRQPTLDIRAGVDTATIGQPLGVIGSIDSFSDLNVAGVPLTSANITINGIFTIGSEASNGLVLLTNQYNPNPALPGSIEVRQIVTDISSGSAIGDSGSVIIDSRDNITIRPDGLIATSSRSNQPGNITLLAGDTIFLSDRARLFSATAGSEDAGDIRILAGSLAMSNQAQITSSTVGGTGNSGNLSITARDNIQLTGQSFLATAALNPSGQTVTDLGDAGNLTIQTGQLILRDLSVITTGTSGRSSAGNLSIQADAITLDNLSLLVSTSLGEGAGGDIAINTGDLSVQKGSGIATVSIGQGNAGSISIQAENLVNVVDPGSSISTSSLGIGAGGQLSIETGRLNVQNSAGIFTSSFDPATFSTETPGITLLRLLAPENFIALTATLESSQAAFQQGNSGNLTVRARESVIVGGIAAPLSSFASGALLSTFATGRASGGDLVIETPRLLVQSGGLIRTDVAGSGDAGSLQIRGAELLEVIDGRIAAETAQNSTGNGGNIQLESQTLRVRNGGTITSSTSGSGNAGNLTVRNADRVNIVGRSSSDDDTPSLVAAQVNAGATGQGGNLTINTRQLNIRDGASISVSTAGTGNAGNLLIQGNSGSPSERVALVNQASLSARSTDQGDAGSLTVNTQDLFLQNASSISAATLSSQGGDIRLQNLDTVRINNSKISASTQNGRAGSITINASDTIRLNQQGRLSVAATQGGSAGDLSLNTDQLILQDGSQATVSSVEAGRAGNLTVTALNLQLNQSQLTAETESGQGGNIDLRGLKRLRLNNSQISTSTQNGQGGSLSLNANQPSANDVQLTDNSRISTQAIGIGNAGNLSLDARQLTVENNSAIVASTQSGQGGDVVLRGLETLQVSNNSAISASTQTGEAGNLRMNSTESITLQDNSRLSVEASSGGTAGNLELRTPQLIVEDNSEITVSSPQGQAGNLTISADEIALNRGELTAQTGLSSARTGANIQLQEVERLTLQNSSVISAEATGNASGGNITIDAIDGFIIANPNQDNDLIARAARGRGGNIQITAQGIFGVAEGIDQIDTTTNDIDASSQFGAAGTVTIDLTTTDPAQGLSELPDSPVDVAGLIDQNLCVVSRGSEFVITGQGGLPPTPNEVLSSEEIWEDWRLTALAEPTASNAAPSPRDYQPASDSQEIVEAQGWIIDADGKVVLTAEVPKPTPRGSWANGLNNQLNCGEES
jgi:filamentous hemagglutinin family protein